MSVDFLNCELSPKTEEYYTNILRMVGPTLQDLLDDKKYFTPMINMLFILFFKGDNQICHYQMLTGSTTY